MPKVVHGGDKWKSVHIPSDNLNDESYFYLASYEELDTCSCEPDSQKSSSGNQSEFSTKVPKRKTVSSREDSSNQSFSNEQLLLMKKAAKRRKKGEKGQTEEQCLISSYNQNIIENILDEVVEDSIGQNQLSSSTGCNTDAWQSMCLSEEVLKGISDSGFTEPTGIQCAIIPYALKGNYDILGAAETGSGKTLAFAIPIAEGLLKEARNCKTDKISLVGLILAPTRELVVQIKRHMDSLLKYTPFKVAAIVGGLSQQKQERLLTYRPHIVVATPGRFWALMKCSAKDSYTNNFAALKYLVIDEMDRMVEKGHFEEMRFIIEVLKERTDCTMQTLLFSATLTFVHPGPKRLLIGKNRDLTTEDKINRLAEIALLRKNFKVFDLTRPIGTAEGLVETRMNCANLIEKDTSVLYLLSRYEGRTLIFMNSVDAARRLHGIISKLKVKPLLLHAKMMQKQRLKNLEKFASRENSILLATDVAARGLDIKNIEHVIHYQVPKTAEIYVHRSGRAARASRKGLAVLLVDLLDVQFYRRICRNLNREKELPLFPVDAASLYNALRERVVTAAALESLEHRIKKIAIKESWFNKMAEEADIILDSKIKSNENANMELESLRVHKHKMERQLKYLLNMRLPEIEGVVKKSRYITSEMVKEHDTVRSRQALHSVEEIARVQNRSGKRSFVKCGKLRLNNRRPRRKRNHK